MKGYDVVVIGSGSGLDVANAAANRGLEVALLEKGPLGGTCLNRGCIPSKMLIHRADVVEEIEDSEKFGIHSSIEDIDYPEIIEEVNEDVGREAEGIEEGIRESDIMDLCKGEASFVDERTLEVNGERIKGRKVIVAAGARPLIAPVDGIEDVDYITSKEALELKEKPEHLVIIGGGYVAAELGHFFGRMGSEVTIIGKRNHLVNREDADVKEKFTQIFSEKYNVKTGYLAEEVRQEGDEIVVRARSNSGGEEIEISGDELLMATGRKPNTDLLKVENADVETDENGFIKVNEYLETSADNVWAFGDIIGKYMFKHAANFEAQYVYTNALTENRHEVDYTVMPRAIFSSPQVAGVGMTEQELEESDSDYITGVYRYEDTAMGSAMKEENGFVKVLVDPESGEILGCHILGPHASILIHEVVVAMKSGSGRAGDITRAIHVHPALSEVVQRAFHNLREG